MGYETLYPVPLAPSIPDWEPRLFAMEPRMEQGERSPYAGERAFDEIVDRTEMILGEEAAAFLEQSRLVPPAGYADFFLY